MYGRRGPRYSILMQTQVGGGGGGEEGGGEGGGGEAGGEGGGGGEEGGEGGGGENRSVYTVCFNSFGTLYDGITPEVIDII